MSNKKIAFFDSGIGGLSILAEAIKQLPAEDYLYFADNLHAPYGTKSRAQVLDYAKFSVEQILKYQIKALVIACNTATSIAAEELRKSYSIPVIGMEPAVKPAIKLNYSNNKKVLVLATDLTLHQPKYYSLLSQLDTQTKVDSLATPELVRFVEELVFNETEISNYFNQKLEQFDLSNYGAIVLGCTHFIFYKNFLKNYLPNHIKIVDGSTGTIKRLSQILKEQNCLNSLGTAQINFLCSDNNQDYLERMRKALNFISQKPY
jgi:glutamate racemase